MTIPQRTVRRVAIVTTPLDRPSGFLDEVVVVEDGSTDAYQTAFNELRRRVREGELDADDVVYVIDTAGQPEVRILDRLLELMVDDGLDGLLVGRDLSNDAVVERARSHATSAWSSLWAGGRLPDVESGYQMFRIGALVHALDYCHGSGYPGTVELAVVLKRLGYRVRVDMVPMPTDRPRPSIRNAATDLTTIPLAAWRSTRPLGIFGRLKVLAFPAAVTAVPVAAAVTLRRVNLRRR